MDLVQLPIGTDKRGLNLSAPHGYLIWSGRKTSIAKAKPFDLSGPWILVSGGKAYGTMEVSLPELVSVEEFDTLFDEHRVTTDERETWWADKKALYLSDIVEFNAFPRPVQIRVFPGMQTVVEEVEFKADEPDLAKHCDLVRFVIEEKGIAMIALEGIEANGETVPEVKEQLLAKDKGVLVDTPEEPTEPTEVIDEPIIVEDSSGVETVVEPEEVDVPDEKALGDGQGVGGPRQGVGGAGKCECPKCGKTVKHERGIPCTEQKCPECGAPMTGIKEISAPTTGVLGWLRQRFEGLLGDLKGYAEPPRLPLEVGFKTFMAKDGSPWLLTWTTNSFIDRDKEIFEFKAIEEYVERHKEDEVKGEFWFWHVPGSKFGEIRWQATSGDHFLVEAGPFDDTPVGRKFYEFFSSHPQEHAELAPGGWGTSHGYYYGPGDLQEGVYKWFEKFETTVLPRSKASNQHSPQMEVLPMNDEQRKALETVGGPELVAQVEQIGEDHSKELEEQGVAFKEAEEAEEVATEIKEAVDSDDEIVVEAKEEAQAAEIAEPSVDSIAGDLAQQIVAGLNLGELAQAIKSLQDSVTGIAEKQDAQAEKQDAQDERLTSLEDGGVEDSLSPLIPMPHAALWRASRAAQTETDEQVAEKSAPTLPDVIAEFSRLVPIA